MDLETAKKIWSERWYVKGKDYNQEIKMSRETMIAGEAIVDHLKKNIIELEDKIIIRNEETKYTNQHCLEEYKRKELDYDTWCFVWSNRDSVTRTSCHMDKYLALKEIIQAAEIIIARNATEQIQLQSDTDFIIENKNLEISTLESQLKSNDDRLNIVEKKMKMSQKEIENISDMINQLLKNANSDTHRQ
jgi:hypothetical protein